MTDRHQLVDIHSHIYLGWYLDELRRRTHAPFISSTTGGERLVVVPGTAGVVLTPAYSSIQEKLRYMDRVGITLTLLSFGNPWLDFVDGQRSVQWAERINSGLASFVQAAPDRLRALGVLPNLSVKHCVREVSVAGDRLQLNGFITGTNICGLPFDDPELDPLWQVLDEQESILLIHPGREALDSSVDALGLTVGVSFPLETTVAASRLLIASVPQRFNNIRFVLAHGGGALPFLIARLDHIWGSHGNAIAAARGFYADSLVYDEETLRFAESRFGVDRLMWGSDHPFTAPGKPSAGALASSIASATASSLLAKPR